uniref:Serpin domain-containing protein n=1 Tax=Panagrolaimus davidi TaxID=227884 RepID=A0A914PBU5_9BILA
MLNSLAMIYAGSNENTSQEIANILGKDKTKEKIIDYYSNFIQRHKTINEDDDKNVELLQKQVYESMSLEASSPTSDSPRRKRRRRGRGSDSDESDENDKTLLPSLQSLIKKMREIVKNSDGSPASLLPLNSILDEMETKIKPKKDDKNVKFNFFATNKLIVDKEIKILDSFNGIIKEKFDGDIQLLDFNEEKNEVAKVC